MATVDKNFRIKHGLVVEGTTATVNGNTVLTENSGDQYILDLIGGETLVKSVDSATLEVNGSGQLSIKSNTFDAYGAAATAQGNAEDYADGLASNYDAAGAAATAQGNAEDYADTVAGTAETNAKNYADGLAVNYDAAGAASTAQNNAEGYADTAAGTAETNAKSYADGLASNYDPVGTAAGLAGNYDAAGSAATAEGNAKDYTDLLLGDNTVDGTSGNTVTDRIATAIADLVDSAPAALDTLNELAAALGDNVDGMTGIATAIGNKLPLAGGTMSGNIAMGANKVTGLGAPTSDNDAARKKYVDDTAGTAETNAKSYADGLASNYDAAGAAATAQGNAEDYADTVAGTAETQAKSYADGLAVNYDAAGAAATAQGNAEDYADDIVGNVISGDTAFTAVNVNSIAGIWAAVATVPSASTITAWAYNSAVFTSAKLLVSIKANGHSQVSEVLVTLDSTGNVAITEFGIVGTNGSLGDVTAINSSGNVSIRVTTSYANSDVVVYATTII